MGKTFDIKWQNDLVNQISAFTSFAFEGNVNDLQPFFDGDKYLYLSFGETVANLLKDKYCVVFYDHKKRGVRMINEKKNDETNQEEQEPCLEADDSVFNSFSFLEKSVILESGERAPNPNVELFKKYYSKEYADAIRNSNDTSLQGDMTVDMRRIHDAMKEYGQNVEAVIEQVIENGAEITKVRYQRKDGSDEKYNNTKPFLFILPDVSRFMTSPGSPSTPENSVLMTLFEATLLNDTPCKLVIVVDKMNDLPAWFEAEGSNPSMKKVFIASPNAEFREDYFNLELAKVMNNVENNSKGIKKFVAYTDKYSLRKLEQLKKYIINSSNMMDKDLNRIDKTVFNFEFGLNENPWLKADTFNKISNLTDVIGQSISGQDHVINQIRDTLQSAVTGVNSSKSNDRRPKAVFFLAGPTGTGKTEMCRQLAALLFGKEDKMIRFDMSEFKEAHNESRLFGAPPGYVGYDAGGELTKAIKENPFSLLLFDEIEKASPTIWDKFLQILGDGRVTDGKGETVYFSETVIVFTSNLGITATRSKDRPEDNALYEAARKKLDEDVGKYESLSSKEEKSVCRKEMRMQLNVIVDYDGLSIKTSEEQYFKIMAKDDDRELGSAWSYFCDFTNEVVKSRIAAYFERLSRREVLGRIGESNIIVYRFIDKDIAINIMDNTIKKFCSYLLNDNVIPLRLSVSEGARKKIIERVQRPEALDLGGRGINMTTEKIISTAVGTYLFEKGKALVEKGGSLSTSEVLNAELIYDDDSEKFKVKDLLN